MGDFYKQRYKKLMLIPIIILIQMLVLILAFPGVSPGIDLTGGNLIIAQSSSPMSEAGIASALSSFDLPNLKI